MNDIKEVQKEICKEFIITDIRRSVRKKEYVNARMTYSYILRQHGYSYKKIGMSIGKDHSTIIHYVSNVEWYAKTDDLFKEKFDRMCNMFIDKKEEDKSIRINQSKREAELKNEINILKSEIKTLNLKLNSSLDRPQFNEQDMKRFENIFKVIKQRTRHGDEYKVFQKLNSMYNVI